MIAWSIQAALHSKCFDMVVVSTEDQEIAKTAECYGATVPFQRPDTIADDFSTTSDVMQHAVRWFEKNNKGVTAACCVYPTAPFLEPGTIKEGLRLIKTARYDYVFTMTSFPFPIQRAIRKSGNDGVVPFYPEHIASRSQDLEPAYHDAGQMYWGTADAWRHNRPIFSSRSNGILLPRFRVQDIDHEEDWLEAEQKFKLLNNQ